MFLTDLAAAVRTSGLQVVEEPGWASRGHGAMSGVRSIVCHHTAGPATGDTPSLHVVLFGRADLAGPLCNLYLSRSGVVHVVAAGCAWHAGVVFVPTTQGNDWSIGIEAEATGVDPWPPAQLAAYVRLCAALVRHYGLSADRVLGHKEVASPLGRKTDPNFDMAAFRTAVSQVLTGDQDMNWTDVAIPDYTKTPAAPLAADVTLGWTAFHAGEAATAALDACATAHTVNAKVDALTAQVAKLQTGGATVDLDALAVKVADLLAQRLAN